MLRAGVTVQILPGTLTRGFDDTGNASLVSLGGQTGTILKRTIGKKDPSGEFWEVSPKAAPSNADKMGNYLVRLASGLVILASPDEFHPING